MIHTIWDIIQQIQIANNKAESSSASSLAATSSTAVDHLRSQLDTLLLANQAMWEILSSRTGVADSELVAKMNEIDLRDGKLDGKVNSKKFGTDSCPGCGKTIGTQRTNCYWCGVRVPGAGPFST